MYVCIHHITHRTTDGQHRSKNVVLIMPSGWTASGGGIVRGSRRCKAKWTYWGRCVCRRNIGYISRDRSGKWLRESIAGFKLL